MSSPVHRFEVSSRPIWRTLGPRPGLLLAFAALIVALLAAFGYVVLNSQAKSRREAERQFGSEATVSAALTASIFTLSASGAEAAAAKSFGGPEVTDQALSALAQKSRLRYVQILDRDGKVLASSRGTPAAVRTRGAPLGAHVRTALAGRPSLSDVLTTGARGAVSLEWALPFTTRHGRRVEIEAFRPGLISKFVGSYLARTRRGASGQAYVLDSRGRVVASSGAASTLGGLADSQGLLAGLAARDSGGYRDGGVDRYYTSAPVEGSSWRVVLTEPKVRLYPVLAGSRSWILFSVLGAFALAGGAGLLFLRRALESGARLAESHRELTAVNATLEERVAERTAAAEERTRELARSNAELEQFASVTSHDLQEPLRKIRMFGDRLHERVGDELAEEPAADLERIQNAARRMQRLIDDLLAFARVSSRGQQFASVDLGEVAEEVLADLEARVIELDARVEVGELPVIEADRTQMRQLLQNLVGNALKFHREGEPPVIRINAQVIAEKPPRHAWEATAGARCAITVEDNGIGFDDKYSERVFAAFERLNSRSAYEGTGIGLSIARKIVWRHGGDITARGAPDEGATFTVTLPLRHQNGHNGHNGHPQGTTR
jgi:signal transduction histidine kinase